MALENGLTPRNDSQENIGAIFNFDQLDEDFIHVNQMMKFFKFGFGKATDEASELIRLGDMSRNEAIKVVERIDGQCHDLYIENFCKYLEISVEDFWEIANNYRNLDLWEKVDSKWQKNFSVGLSK